MLLVLHAVTTFTVAVLVQSFVMSSAALNMETFRIGSRLLMPAPAGARDGMLRWFEEYARRLQEGVYGVSLQPKTHMDLGVPPTLAIDLYPLKPPVGFSCDFCRRILPPVEIYRCHLAPMKCVLQLG